MAGVMMDSWEQVAEFAQVAGFITTKATSFFDNRFGFIYREEE